MHPDAVMTYEYALITVQYFPARLDWNPSPRTSPSNPQAVNHNEASPASVLNLNVCNSTLFHDPRMPGAMSWGKRCWRQQRQTKAPPRGRRGQVHCMSLSRLASQTEPTPIEPSRLRRFPPRAAFHGACSLKPWRTPPRSRHVEPPHVALVIVSGAPRIISWARRGSRAPVAPKLQGRAPRLFEK
jgi:hypothetical protein